MFLDQLSELVLILSYDKGHAIVLIVSQRIELLGLSLTGRKKKQQPYCTVGDTHRPFCNFLVGHRSANF
jgi:hypothetical protein